ncbi:hypothetical protein BGZ74_006228 [Mortierella antarctica]|nr:hypothetical protein BGZ74_006228 [Mortierella antarctica]
MATEYLAKVNQELLEIESFFQELYQSSSALPPTYTPGLLPYLRLNGASSHGSDRRMSTASSYKDQLLDDFVLEGVATPVSSAPSISLYSDSEEIFTADLRVRYKELKAIQDQLHLELTRHQLWQERIQHEKTSTPPSASECQSCNSHEARPDKVNKEAEETPVQAQALSGRLGSLWSNLTGHGPTANDTAAKSSALNGRGRYFRRRCIKIDDKAPAQSSERVRTDDSNSTASTSSVASVTTGRSFRQASLLIKLGYLFSVLMMFAILVGVVLLPGPGVRHGPHTRERYTPVMSHGDSMASVSHRPVIDLGGPLAGIGETGKAHRCKGFMKHKHTKHQHGNYPWPRH